MKTMAVFAMALVSSRAPALDSGARTQVEISATYSVSSTLLEASGRQSWIGRKTAPLVEIFQLGVLRAYDLELKLARGARRQWLRWFPPVPPLPAEVALENFEDPRGFGWMTGGYVEIHVSSLHVTEGSVSCRAMFLLATDMTESPSASPWKPAMSLQLPPAGVAAPLPLTDWSLFSVFKADVYNDASVEVPLTLTLVDIKGYRFEETRRLAPKAGTVFEVPLENARKARLDLSNMSILSLSVDAAQMKERPVLFIDNIRCELTRAETSSTPTSTRPEAGQSTPAGRGGK